MLAAFVHDAIEETVHGAAVGHIFTEKTSGWRNQVLLCPLRRGKEKAQSSTGLRSEKHIEEQVRI